MDISKEIFEIYIEGDIYCSPCRPGTVAPSGATGSFKASGTISEIGAAWKKWRHVTTQCKYGYTYPQRYIQGAWNRPMSVIVNELIRRHGGLWGQYCGTVSQLLKT